MTHETRLALPLSAHVLRVVLRATTLAKAREEAERLEEPDESAGGELDESALRGALVVTPEVVVLDHATDLPAGRRTCGDQPKERTV